MDYTEDSYESVGGVYRMTFTFFPPLIIFYYVFNTFRK